MKKKKRICKKNPKLLDLKWPNIVKNRKYKSSYQHVGATFIVLTGILVVYMYIDYSYLYYTLF